MTSAGDTGSFWEARYDPLERHCVGCGLQFTPDSPTDRKTHHRKHRSVVQSVRNRWTIALQNGILEATPESPVLLQRIAYQMGKEQRHERELCNTVYYPALPAHRQGEDFWHEVRGYEGRCFVPVREGWAVGLVVVRRKQQTGYLDGEGPSQRALGRLRRCIDSVYVLPSLRRQGIAREVVQHIARHYEEPLSELAWMTPFSTAGRAFAHACCGKRLWLY
jgi:GNAT superfamily N-acetyltransferase